MKKEGSKNVHDLLKLHRETLESIARYLKMDDPYDITALKEFGTPFIKNLERVEQDLILIGRVLKISFSVQNSASVSRFMRKAMRRTLNLRQTRLNEFFNREFMLKSP
jgi:hypothetical protein